MNNDCFGSVINCNKYLKKIELLKIVLNKCINYIYICLTLN